MSTETLAELGVAFIGVFVSVLIIGILYFISSVVELFEKVEFQDIKSINLLNYVNQENSKIKEKLNSLSQTKDKMKGK